jgi:hypothetical protein
MALSTINTVPTSALPANTVSLLPANVIPTSYRINLPPGPGTDGQVLQQLSHSVDLTGTVNINLNWLTPSGGGGGTLTTQTNGTNNISQTVLNLINSAATNGITLTHTNTGGGIVQLGYTGTLNNSGITNPSVTINTAAPLGGGGVLALGGTLSLTCTGCLVGTQYTKLRCETGLGDGLNAMTAGTYLQSFCYNDSGVTWTLTGLRCLTDNNGTSTMNASNGAGTGLLTGAITCTNAWAAGTQSATVTITNGDYVKFTFIADGASKQTSWVVSMTQ